MSFLNYKLGYLIHENDAETKNPTIKTPDITLETCGIRVDNDLSEHITVLPGRIKDVSVTSRSPLWDLTTQLQFSQHLLSSSSSKVRLKWTGTGTAPAFRTNRNIGGASDTTVSISRINDYVSRMTVTGGTTLTLGSVLPNDFLKIDYTNDTLTSPFATSNQKEFLIQNAGSNYIDFIDNGNASEEVVTLGVNFNKVIKVLSQGQVNVGDELSVSGAANPSNHGKFEIINVSDDFVEFVNPLILQETLLYNAQSFVIYEYTIGFASLRGTGPFSVRFGEQTEWTKVGLLGQYSLFFGALNTHKIQIKNDNSMAIKVSVQTAEVLV